MYYSVTTKDIIDVINKFNDKDLKLFAEKINRNQLKKILDYSNLDVSGWVEPFSNNKIPEIPLESDFISGVGYDYHERVLQITFHHKNTYQYADVDADIFNGFIENLHTGESHGRYFHRYIKDKFEYVLIS